MNHFPLAKHIDIPLNDAFFKALAHPVRRRILEILAEKGRGRPIGDFVSAFDISQPAVSRHLRKLLKARLVCAHKHREAQVYRMDPQALQTLASWAGFLRHQADQNMPINAQFWVLRARQLAERKARQTA